MNAHLAIYLCPLVRVCFHFCVNVGHQRRLKGGEECVASRALSCSGWRVDNLKIGVCGAMVPRVAWLLEHLQYCPVMGKCVHVEIFIVKAGFPQCPRGVFSVTSGCTIIRVFWMIWFGKWVAGCWLRYKWIWLQNMADGITEGVKWTGERRSHGFGGLYQYTHNHYCIGSQVPSL